MAYPWNEADYTAEQLRDDAYERGLVVSGTKADLVARLNKYEEDSSAESADALKPADQADVPSLEEKAAELPDEAKTGPMKRNEALDALRAAERADVESGGDSEMKRWHEQYGTSKPAEEEA